MFFHFITLNFSLRIHSWFYFSQIFFYLTCFFALSNKIWWSCSFPIYFGEIHLFWLISLQLATILSPIYSDICFSTFYIFLQHLFLVFIRFWHVSRGGGSFDANKKFFSFYFFCWIFFSSFTFSSFLFFCLLFLSWMMQFRHILEKPKWPVSEIGFYWVETYKEH